jgi:hypothetical protein
VSTTSDKFQAILPTLSSTSCCKKVFIYSHPIYYLQHTNCIFVAILTTCCVDNSVNFESFHIYVSPTLCQRKVIFVFIINTFTFNLFNLFIFIHITQLFSYTILSTFRATHNNPAINSFCFNFNIHYCYLMYLHHFMLFLYIFAYNRPLFSKTDNFRFSPHTTTSLQALLSSISIFIIAI